MGPDKSKTRLQLTIVTLKTVKKINSHAFMVKNTWKIPTNKKKRKVIKIVEVILSECMETEGQD